MPTMCIEHSTLRDATTPYTKRYAQWGAKKRKNQNARLIFPLVSNGGYLSKTLHKLGWGIERNYARRPINTISSTCSNSPFQSSIACSTSFSCSATDFS